MRHYQGCTNLSWCGINNYHILNSGTPIEITTNQTTPLFSHIVSPHAYMINMLYFEYAKYHSSDRLYFTVFKV